MNSYSFFVFKGLELSHSILVTKNSLQSLDKRTGYVYGR